jgi:hypothetical protein
MVGMGRTMMTIRHQQMDVLRAAALQNFLERLATHLVQTAGVAIDSSAVQAALALDAARDFDLVAQCDVAEFASIVCRRFGGFPVQDLPKPAQNLLLAYAVPGRERVRAFGAWTFSS